MIKSVIIGTYKPQPSCINPECNDLRAQLAETNALLAEAKEMAEYYATQVEPEMEKSYESALALFNDLDRKERIQKLKLPAREFLRKLISPATEST